MNKRKSQNEVFTEIDVKFPQMTKDFLARVKATFKRCGLARNPMPVVRVVHNMMISLSWPWYESIVFTGILNVASVDDFLWIAREKWQNKLMHSILWLFVILNFVWRITLRWFEFLVVVWHMEWLFHMRRPLDQHVWPLFWASLPQILLRPNCSNVHGRYLIGNSSNWKRNMGEAWSYRLTVELMSTDCRRSNDSKSGKYPDAFDTVVSLHMYFWSLAHSSRCHRTSVQTAIVPNYFHGTPA